MRNKMITIYKKEECYLNMYWCYQIQWALDVVQIAVITFSTH